MTSADRTETLRILLVSEDVPGWGGLAKHVLNLATMLHDAGHAVSVMGSAELPWEAVTDRLPEGIPFLPTLRGHKRGWKEQALGVFNPLRRTVCARRFAGVIGRYARDFDVVHYHGHLPNLGAFIPTSINFVQTRHDQGSDCLTHLRFRHGKPCTETAPDACAGCATVSPNAVQRVVSSMAAQQYRREVAAAFTRHRTIFVSRFLQERAEHTLGQAPGNTVIHNYIDDASLAIIDSVANREADAHARPYVLLASVLTPYKGVRNFLEAFVGDQRPPFDLVIAGGGELEDELRRRFDRPWIHFVGWVDSPRVMRLMRRASAVVVASIWEEAFCYSALEGLACGIPVYALRLGGVPELARYQRLDKQLRLFDDMDRLARALDTLDVSTPAHREGRFDATASYALDAILAVYNPPAHRRPA